ncbi:MAG: PD-(D/E)XK nuclease family protein [Deltaproteobacteria bacterium]|nr:PD-(D/E)XK nuclease family protein [Deltaproteobacteria bacterium]
MVRKRKTVLSEDAPGAVHVLWSTANWARAVAALPLEPPLPEATVIVPNERAAHALRRELCRLGLADRLPGVRFVSPFTAARETLLAAGVTFTAGEESLRPLRVRGLLRRERRMRYFDPVQLRTRPGWDEAFARTITELEGAGESARDPALAVDLREADLFALWRELDAEAGSSWSAARILREAAERLPAACPLHGPILIAVTGHETAAHAAFLRALPRRRLAVLAARPVREEHVERLGRLFGEEAAAALRTARAPQDGATDRDRLASRLFEPPERASPRPPGTSLDGSVGLELSAGVEDEVEAAADWVAHEVLEHRTPLEELAVLLPNLDPVAGMLVDRIERLPWPDGALPVCVQGGLPATATAAGTRILGLLRALGDALPASRVAVALPWLRLEGDDGHLSTGEAVELAFALGTVGGTASNPRGALEWKARLAERDEELQRTVDSRLSTVDSPPEAPPEHREVRRRRERLLRNLRAVRASFAALADLAERILAGEPLQGLHGQLARFFERHARLPAAGDEAVPALLLGAVGAACADGEVAELRGADALGFVESTLAALRVRGGRFGEPAIYIGTIAGSAPLPFRAVRVVGLAEGHFPSAEHVDPVLPAERRRGAGPGVVEPSDRTLSQLHAFDRIVRNTSARLVLSVPASDVNGTEREPSALLLDVASTIVPDEGGTGRAKVAVPGLADIDRLWFAPARVKRRAWRSERPIGRAAIHDAAAAATAKATVLGAPGGGAGPIVVPGGWAGARELELARLLEPEARGNEGPMGGFVASASVLPVIPGLSSKRPLSPTAVRTLLQCPYRFLLSSLLGWQEPVSAPSGLDLDPLSFGSLFHRVAELFAREHGAEFGARARGPDEWKKAAAAIARRAFDDLAREIPLAGPDVRRQQLDRLLAAVAVFVDYDWNGGRPRTLFACERAFGEPEPFELRLGSNTLYLHGRMDRIDVEGDRTLVRDLKTGRAHLRAGREADPEPRLDVQLALYGLAAERLAGEWGTPARIEAAYAYVERRPALERAFRDDEELLRDASLRWLDVAARLLAERSFPRTPAAADCDYCPFVAVCGEAAPGRRFAPEPPAAGAAADFHALRAEEAPGP